jgi:uncharacterized C2H2 Zn-finger protein
MSGMAQQETDREGNICTKCGATFDTEEELQRHIEEEHGANSK